MCERVDLTELKATISTKLKNNSSLYWDILKKFLTRKVTKIELDNNVVHLLGEDNVGLHNQFLLAILRNANCNSTSPITSATGAKKAKPNKSKKKPKGTSLEGKKARDLPKRLNAKLLSSGEIAPSAGNLIKRFRETNGVIIRPIVQRVRPPPRPDIPDNLFINSPDLQALRQRMQRAAIGAGLTSVSNDSVPFLMAALEWHMKDILSICRPSIHNIPPEDQDKTITLRDLRGALRISPYLLGEDAPLSQERLLANHCTDKG